MKNVIFRGPCLTSSGYGQHSRMVVRWLLTREDFNVKFQPVQWGSTPWIIDRNREEGLIGKILDNSVPFTDSGFDLSFQLILPNEWDANLSRFNVGLTAGIETDKCNPTWTQACNKMNAIIVPSEHAKQSLNPKQVTCPMFVVPESYPVEMLKDASSLPSIGEFSTRFNFLVFGQVTGTNAFNDRKNVFFTLKWLFEEFKNDPDVGVIIKTNMSRNTIVDKNNTVETLQKLIKETRSGTYPRLHLVHGDLTNDEVTALYKHPTMKALVSATRGEGFGLPLLEAAVAGLPIIATPWSGHMDFLGKGKFVQLFHQLQQVHQSRVDNIMFMPDARWAEVSETDFKAKCRKFYKGSEIPRQWAKDLSEKLRVTHSQDAINVQYDNVVKELNF